MQTDRSLNQLASIKIVHELYQDGLLNVDAFVAAKKVLRPVSAWFQWASQLLLFFGATLVLSGIIYFFAYNWAEMGKFLKFGLIELSIMGCIFASFFRGIDQFSGKTLILSASVLTGVLLAVYGQTYQTGADAYELFRGWAFLIAAWVVISEFAALWFLWLIIVNTGIILFWQQVGLPGHAIRYEWLCLAIALINSLSLVLRETGLRNGLKWLAGKWFQAILLTTVLVALSIPSIHLIVASSDSYNGPSMLTGLAFGIWVLVALVGYLCYRYKLREMIPISIIVMNGCVILLIFIGKILFHNNHSEAGIALLFALVILGVASGAALWLKRVNAVITIDT